MSGDELTEPLGSRDCNACKIERRRSVLQETSVKQKDMNPNSFKLKVTKDIPETHLPKAFWC